MHDWIKKNQLEKYVVVRSTYKQVERKLNIILIVCIDKQLLKF